MGVTMQKFVPSHKPRGKSPGYGTFGEFMVSDQMRKPVFRAAVDIVAIAKTLVDRSKDERDGHYTDKFSIHSGGLQTVVGKRRNPRVMVQISNSAKNAVAVEFGSGPPATGPSTGEEREQGGWSKAKRPLGRAGVKVGRLYKGQGDE